MQETDTTPVLIEAGEYFALTASILGSIIFGLIMFIH